MLTAGANTKNIYEDSGEASLSMQSNTVSGQLINAAPGLFFAIGGIAALIVSILRGVQISFDNNDGHVVRVSNISHG